MKFWIFQHRILGTYEVVSDKEEKDYFTGLRRYRYLGLFEKVVEPERDAGDSNQQHG